MSVACLAAGTAFAERAGESRPARAAPRLVLYLESEGPASRRLFADFVRKLDALVRPGAVQVEFFPIGDLGAAMRERLRAELAREPAAVVAVSGGAAATLRAVSADVPMVFASNADPVASGLVTDLNRPGGRQTGITSALQTFVKRIELLREAAPHARRIGVLLEKEGEPADLGLRAADHAALGDVRLEWRRAGSPGEIFEAIAGFGARGIDAWYIPYNGVAFHHGESVLAALDAARRPAVFERAKFAEGGGLLAYQHMVDDPIGRLAEMLASVLEGVPPGEIPVVRPTRFELVLNLAAARRLGISVPKALVKRADRVILD